LDGQERFTLAGIGGGATIERFDLGLQAALDNIQDPNTDPKKPRKVILTLTINPDQDRNYGKYTIDVQTKLAPIMPHPGRVFMGRTVTGKGVASEEHPTQVEMDGILNPGNNVKAFGAKE